MFRKGIWKKRDELKNIANKGLPLNSGITLVSFKEVIYKVINRKKYDLHISDDYLKNYLYNWKSKNRINIFYYTHDNPPSLDDQIFL